jgi:hypothetical protein
MIDREGIQARFLLAAPHLDERGRRILAATEARSAGFGGIVGVALATGVARSTIGRGLKDLDCPALPVNVVRCPGGGRPTLTSRDPTLLEDLEKIVKPVTLGDPMRPLQWVSKSLAKIAAALKDLGHNVSANTVAMLLVQIGYLRLSVRKTDERSNHPDRDAQFIHINDKAAQFIALEEPVTSVDTKKKEPVGNFKNSGSDYRPRGCNEHVRVHDFPDKELGKAIPYGVYDVGANAGFVSVGVDHDTAEMAVNSIRKWWNSMGRFRYPNAKRLMITADCGGSNGSRVRLWKWELQKLADELNIEIHVCHYPPGCSKWNKIEHRLFCHITQNWRGTPLTSLMTVVELIAGTSTKTGLTVRSELDQGQYPMGIKVTDAQWGAINIVGDEFHPEWNYCIRPTRNEALVFE